jgi:hypothetical protein
MLCDYGCKQEANFVLKNGKHCCSKSTSSCQSIKSKNSKGGLKSYKDGDRKSGKDQYNDLPQATKDSMNCRKGVLILTDDTFTYGGKGNHKKLLLAERGYKCEECNLIEWMKKPIPLELEHVDGDGKNNVRENLKLLCCNCHAQTPTWRRKKVTLENNARYTDDVMIEAIQNSYSMHGVLKLLDLRWGSNSTIRRVMKQYNIEFKQKEVKEKFIEVLPAIEKVIRRVDTKNSQYGTCWVCNLTLQCNRKIKIEELEKYINDGWLKTRSMVFKMG